MNRLPKLFFAAAILGTGAFFTPAVAQEKIRIEGIAAIVGKDIILDSEIEGAYMQMKMRGNNIDESGKCRILEELMTEKLLAYQAEVDSLEVSDGQVYSQVEQHIEQIKRELGGTITDVLELYKKPDEITLREDLFKLVKSQNLADEMRRKIVKDIDATPEEVRQYFNSIPPEELPTFDTEFELSRIIIKPKVSEASRQEIIDKLKGIKKEIEAGEDFSIKALVYSEDFGSSSKGGTIEGVKRGMMVKEFEAAAYNLEEGEISDPVETEYGFHLIRVNKRKGEVLDLQHILIRPKYTPEEMMEAEKILDTITSRIRQGEITFEEAVKNFSQDETTKYNNGNMMNPYTGDTTFPIDQLDPQLYNAVAHLAEGELSKNVFLDEPQGGKYAVYYVRRRIEPHRANYATDFNRLKNYTKQQKTEKALQNWIDKKIKDTYVKMSDQWEECQFKSDWRQGIQKVY